MAVLYGERDSSRSIKGCLPTITLNTYVTPTTPLRGGRMPIFRKQKSIDIHSTKTHIYNYTTITQLIHNYYMTLRLFS
jgi:hypothetical protein